MKRINKVRAGIEMGWNHLVRLGNHEAMYVHKKAGFTFVSDAQISYGDIVDVTVDKENAVVVLRPLVEEEVQADSWLVPISGRYSCDTIETVVAEKNGNQLLVIPHDTVITHYDGTITYWGKERVYIPLDLAPAWRLLRGK